MYNAARCVPLENETDARVRAAGVTTPSGLQCCVSFPFEVCFPFIRPFASGGGKCSVIFVCGSPSDSFVGARCRASSLVMKCWSVALSRASGEGVFGMAVQSFSKIRLHLWTMGRSHIGVDCKPFLR
jgi:hypothetical protein